MPIICIFFYKVNADNIVNVVKLNDYGIRTPFLTYFI